MNKKFTPADFWALALGVVLILGGVVVLASPQAGMVPHETRSKYGPAGNPWEVTRPGEKTFSGAMAIFLGSGMIAISVYRGKK